MLTNSVRVVCDPVRNFIDAPSSRFCLINKSILTTGLDYICNQLKLLLTSHSVLVVIFVEEYSYEKEDVV